MSNKNNKNQPTIKYYHILLLSIILSPLLIINSNFVTEKRNQQKLNIEAGKKFQKILIGRYLQSFEEGMEKVCNKGSAELKDYYLTGALDKLGISNATFSQKEDENPEYINALIDVIKGFTGDESDNDILDNGKTYGMHMLGIGIFLAIAILSIPGWVVCCSCCCCNCCCCCCCKKPNCKLPFFIVTTVLYLLVIAICIFGLVKSNSVFEGLADTECSILKFCNEIIDGETKEEKPKWVGINGVTKLLGDVKNKINLLGQRTLQDLRNQDTEIKTQKSQFEDLLQENSIKVTSESPSATNQNYKEVANDAGTNYKYRLDITTKEIYGEFNKANKKVDPEGSFIGVWFKEYSETAEKSEQSIDEATQKFETILADDSVTSSLDDAKSSIDEIGSSINEIKDGIASGIVDISDYIDEYGKFGFKIFYTILIVIDGLIAFLMFLLCFFSGKLCNNCCLCRCAFKCLIHLLWNLLALFMIITFLIGFLFSFIGTIGKDMVTVLTYFISEENLGKKEGEGEPLLFGSEGGKLNKCFNGDGDILEDLGFDLGDMGSFDELNNINEEIDTYEQTFKDITQKKFAYSEMKKALEERVEYKTTSFSIISSSTSASPYELSNLLEQYNIKVAPQMWSHCCTCVDTTGKTCHEIKSETLPTSSDTDTQTIENRIKAIKYLVNVANGNGGNSFKPLTNALNTKYDEFLNSELETLKIFNKTITDINSLFDDYVGENGSVFDFFNCKFIGNNILVILKNLKECLGTDFYTVGVCLIIAGCSMAISIIFTILLIVIINISVEENKKNNNNNNSVKEIPYAN